VARRTKRNGASEGQWGEGRGRHPRSAHDTLIVLAVIAAMALIGMLIVLIGAVVPVEHRPVSEQGKDRDRRVRGEMGPTKGWKEYMKKDWIGWVSTGRGTEKRKDQGRADDGATA